MIAANIHILGDFAVFFILIGLIVAGRMIGGAMGGLLIFVGLVALVVSGIDSAIKLFDPTDWSFLERLYHLGWVVVGIGAAWLIGYGVRTARDRARERDG